MIFGLILKIIETKKINLPKMDLSFSGIKIILAPLFFNSLVNSP